MNSNGNLLLLGIIFILILSTIGLVIGDILDLGLYGMVIGFELSLGIVMVIYFSSDRALLKIYDAKPMPKTHNIHELIGDLASRFDVPTPKMFLANTSAPILFAIGRNARHSSIVISNSLLNLLDEDEVGAVLAHEMYYMEAGEILVNTTIAHVAGKLTSFTTSNSKIFGPILATLVAPPAAFLIKLVIPESREHFADLKSVDIFRKADKLMSALEKISRKVESGNYVVNPSHAHLFIVNPLQDKGVEFMGRKMGSYNKLFNTHPSIHERLDILKSFRMNK